jgi:hypothetical protein
VLHTGAKIVISPQLQECVAVSTVAKSRDVWAIVVSRANRAGSRSDAQWAGADEEGATMKRFFISVTAIIIGLWVVLPQVLFTVDEGDQVIITQFGAYVRTVATPVSRQAASDPNSAAF